MGWKKVKNICFFLWSVKSLFLLPWDIYTDVRLAETHIRNGNHMWGVLTAIFLLPSFLFPYHYFHILKCIILKFNYKFKSPPSKPSKSEVRDQEKKKIWWNGMFAYFEDIPQFILQVYILWITPFECFSLETLVHFENNWDDLDKVRFAQSIFSSFLSIACHVVPFFEARRNEKWKLFSVNGFFLHLLSGVFLNIIPKLVLISWTFSVLNWYGWFFMMAILLMAGLIIILLYPKRPLKAKLLLTVQVTFGYMGGRRGLLISALLLTSFLFPLGFALNAAIASSFLQENDTFAIFPSNPFPSRTVCFTNASKIEQEIRWNYRTDKLSDSCNFTYSAVPCHPEQRDFIITQLSLMIGVMSAGPSLVLLSILCATLVFYLAKVIIKTSNKVEEEEGESYLEYGLRKEEEKKEKYDMSDKEILSEMFWLPCTLCQKQSKRTHGMVKYSIWLISIPIWIIFWFFYISYGLFMGLAFIYTSIFLVIPYYILKGIGMLLLKSANFEKTLPEFLSGLFNFV